jgi:hypothetical protein
VQILAINEQDFRTEDNNLFLPSIPSVNLGYGVRFRYNLRDSEGRHEGMNEGTKEATKERRKERTKEGNANKINRSGIYKYRDMRHHRGRAVNAEMAVSRQTSTARTIN